ncbi:hypothetical protein O6H91_17G040700 [Diphasiastrum complanatum]|uniref:Uncharacterized protein n=1 Tax=Diphasiastrum complanatum TaxID=34168 RepID=A0ACC2B620_DIPCM|nr:hypothetical protein O6H91_Y417700 [Diphasiastrum complanatum]KAJ7525192.1 hypothetical protein O6H91_17G040700 [Diphasiastrum complanatum]
MVGVVDIKVSLASILLLAWCLSLNLVAGQGAPAPAPLNETCEGVVLQYQVDTVTKIYPFLAAKDPDQPYKFESTLTLTNQGFKEVKAWQVFVGFQHREILVTAVGVVLGDGQQLPAVVGNGTTLAGFPQTDLKNSIETAGDATQITATISLTGTEFGVAPPSNPLPNNISLLNEGWKCGLPISSQNNNLQVCCVENATAADLTPAPIFLPREMGDITISYDVLQTADTNYWAQVTISNDNPLGRLDYWNLTWEWSQGEFINSMQGAATAEQDQSDCLKGVAGTYYKDLDFSQVMNCQQSPVIHDLPLDKTNDTKVGFIPFCCRNGTLLPPIMDPSKSKSAFKLQVFKIPPHTPRGQLVPPINWNIGAGYHCGQPRLVAPLEFPDPSGNFHHLSAVSSWQLTCNITTSSLANALDTSQPLLNASTNTPPSCCVSFSAYYNTSAVPCKTCACGCTTMQQPTCDTKSEALLVPYNVLLLPSENRTSKAVAWASLNHFAVPKQLPCSDNCGVNINWHIVSDYTRGWSARLTVLNWDTQPVVDWFAAIEFEKAMPGYQNVFSFNGTQFSRNNSTLFLQGKPGLNYLVGEFDNNAGKAQSILSFTKDTTPGINIAAGDGFPSRVVFNGEECALPNIIPSGAEGRYARYWASFLLAFVVLLCLVSMN